MKTNSMSNVPSALSQSNINSENDGNEVQDDYENDGEDQMDDEDQEEQDEEGDDEDQPDQPSYIYTVINKIHAFIMSTTKTSTSTSHHTRWNEKYGS